MGSTNKMCSIESPTKDRKMLLRKGLHLPRMDNFCNKTKGAQAKGTWKSQAQLHFFFFFLN